MSLVLTLRKIIDKHQNSELQLSSGKNRERASLGRAGVFFLLWGPKESVSGRY